MMSQAQVFEFQALLKRVASVFRVRTDTEDFRGLASSYFRALNRYDLPDLERGADVWIARESKFPKPYEWAHAIPHPERVIEAMSEAKALEFARAESLKWEDAPCQCLDCREASVDWKPLRFVPEFTSDDHDRTMRDPVRDRLVTAGHWAHGEELAGYYRAKGAFYQKVDELGLRRSVVGIGTPEKPSLTRRPMTHIGGR